VKEGGGDGRREERKEQICTCDKVNNANSN